METTPTTPAPHESSDRQPKQPPVKIKIGEVTKRDDAAALTSPYSKEGFGESVFTDSVAYELGVHAAISFDVRDDLPKDENGIAVVANFSSENHYSAGAEYSLLDVRNTGINAPFLLVKGEFTRESFAQAASEQTLAIKEGREAVDPIQKMRKDVKGVRPSRNFSVSYGIYVADKQYDTSGFDFNEKDPEGLTSVDFGISYNQDTGKITVGTGDIGVKVRVNQESGVKEEVAIEEDETRFEGFKRRTRGLLGLTAVTEAKVE
jgi:hypothetical protein